MKLPPDVWEKIEELALQIGENDSIEVPGPLGLLLVKHDSPEWVRVCENGGMIIQSIVELNTLEDGDIVTKRFAIFTDGEVAAHMFCHV